MSRTLLVIIVMGALVALGACGSSDGATDASGSTPSTFQKVGSSVSPEAPESRESAFCAAMDTLSDDADGSAASERESALIDLAANAPTDLTDETQRFVSATREVTVASAGVADPDQMTEQDYEEFRTTLSDDAQELLDSLAAAQASGRFTGHSAIDRVLAHTAVECLHTQKYRPAG